MVSLVLSRNDFKLLVEDTDADEIVQLHHPANRGAILQRLVLNQSLNGATTMLALPTSILEQLLSPLREAGRR